MNSFDMGRVPAVSFGNGRVADTAQVVGDLGGGPVFLIADAALAELGIAPELANTLNDAGLACTLSAEIVGEPKEALIDRLTEQTRSSGARVVVGLGGGAAMDAAKLVAAIAPSETEARLYALASAPIPKTGLPAIAIPTTAGTGSEVTRTSIVSTNSGAKNWYWSEELMFAHAILDPGLTVSLPPHLTAWTGIDAVAHALEAVTSRRSNAAGQMYGLEALRLLSDALPIAVTQGDDIDARSQVLWASTLAGLALHNCNTHMGHNISQALGSIVRIHHGLATGLALEASLPWLTARPEGASNYAMASRAMAGEETADALPGRMSALMRACGIAPELPAECAGVSKTELAVEMKNDANIGMAQNSACPMTHEDIDELAGLMMQKGVAAAA